MFSYSIRSIIHKRGKVKFDSSGFEAFVFLIILLKNGKPWTREMVQWLRVLFFQRAWALSPAPSPYGDSQCPHLSSMSTRHAQSIQIYMPHVKLATETSVKKVIRMLNKHTLKCLISFVVTTETVNYIERAYCRDTIKC